MLSRIISSQNKLINNYLIHHNQQLGNPSKHSLQINSFFKFTVIQTKTSTQQSTTASQQSQPNHNPDYIKTLNAPTPKGKLTILPTPIGNLQDLSPNIIKALFRADVIGCEDRRVAGKLYNLIKSKRVIEQIVESFGEIGLSSIVLKQGEDGEPQPQLSQTEQAYMFYNYANMNEKSRKKFLRKMEKQAQETFKIEFLKYRALKIMKRQDEWRHEIKQDKFDELYGLDSSSLEHIESQIQATRRKKGRGILIPLNTYSETKMYSMVRLFLQTKNVAIVSDAGMPCISDPGWKMVRMIRQRHPQIQIEVIGGPSSVSMMVLLATMSAIQNSEGIKGTNSKDMKDKNTSISQCSLSGRFQGFAPQQLSQMGKRTVQMSQAKKKDFSIHFINSRKLPAKLLQLEQIYGADQRILLANELTKMYERKYHGTIGDLSKEMKAVDQFGRKNEFTQGVGELSYLIYPGKQQNGQGLETGNRKGNRNENEKGNGKREEKKESEKKRQKENIRQDSQRIEKEQEMKSSQRQINSCKDSSLQENSNPSTGSSVSGHKLQSTPLPRTSLISIDNFLDSLIEAISSAKKQNKQLNDNKNAINMTTDSSSSQPSQRSSPSSRDLAQLVCSVFAIKPSESKKIVYNKKFDSKLPEQHIDKSRQTSTSGRKVGRGRGKKQ